MQNGCVESMGIFDSPSSEAVSGLALLHDRLDLHYQKLANARKQQPGQPPVYIIEHGLSASEVLVLGDLVKDWVRRFRPSRKLWLPFVVYATEVGYAYEGDDYWPTLGAKAKGWEKNVSRQFLKARFQEFAQLYSGATPRGKWASHFSIICWPITHALLPSDLQRQFARLLYDSRSALTSQLLNEPRQLGRVLASRSGATSKRFQQFAENTELLGHVACALLGDGGSDAMIEPEALSRITVDLTMQRQARNWFNDARSSADRLRLKGVTRAASAKPETSAPNRRSRSLLPSVPFSIHSGRSGWQVRLSVPDITPIFTDNPEVMDEVRLVRCRVAGTDRRPKGRGWLLHPGQQVALERWPGPDNVLFELEGASRELSDVLDQEARTPSTRPWLFRVGVDGIGRIVRSGVVRPGARYVVVGPSLGVARVPWIRDQPVTCAGASALLVDVPRIVDVATEEAIRAVGCGVQAVVGISPAGLVPAAWDGEGSGEWLVGDRPMLKLTSTHRYTECTVVLNDSDTTVISGEALTDNSVVLQLPELDQGLHDLTFSFLSHDGSLSIPAVRVEIRIREAEQDRSSGTFRDPIRLLPTPPGASLEDVWDERAALEVEGPDGMSATVTATLNGREGECLATYTFAVTLPVLSGDWSKRVQSKLRSSPDFQAAYDDASHITIEVGNQDLGVVSTRFERELEALRWGFHRTKEGLVLRLLESADTGDEVEVSRYSFGTPELGMPEDPTNRSYWNEKGGLFVARVQGHEASAILPPIVHDLQDLRSARSAVRLRPGNRVASRVKELVDLAELWSGSRSPGHLLARDRRTAVARAINAEIGSIVGGGEWAILERQYENGLLPSVADLGVGVASGPQWSQFRSEIVELALDAEQLRRPPIEELAMRLRQSASSSEFYREDTRPSSVPSDDSPGSVALYKIGGSWLAEALLRLASVPASLSSLEHMHSQLNLSEIIEFPIPFRSARMLAIAAEELNGEVWQWA